MQPFTISHRRGARRRGHLDLSFLLDAPAGRDGYITIRDGHLVKPDGSRLRLWGVNVTDWGPGSVIIPSKRHAPLYARALARLGINCVRLHFLDLDTPRGLISSKYNDSQHLDPAQLDRLDYWVSQLKKRGIYCDLNLVVGRSYRAGDNVHGHDRIGWAKPLTYFDPRLIELQKDYARQILTHYNPYTGSEYRSEPSIAIIELVNENSLIEAWHGGYLPRAGDERMREASQGLPGYYLDMLDRLYQDYLGRLDGEEVSKIRAQAGVGAAQPVPRLTPDEFAAAPRERFQAEAAFYMQVERDYFSDMKRFVKEDLGVRSLLIGSNDHMYSQSGYPMVWSNSVLDIIDGHMYWQHPAHYAGRNTPMVNDPLHSTVVRLSRSALAGKPYTVSEVNHIFPDEWISEGVPILAAYGALQDWDGIIWYTFEPKCRSTWEPYVGDTFDISLDPVRLPQLASGALMFLRRDVSAARTTVERTYTLEQVRETLRMPPSRRPYYTPGFPLSLALRHKVRIGSLEGPPTGPVKAENENADTITSDTEELTWSTSPQGLGSVTVDTPRSQALIGFVSENRKPPRNLAADVTNPFCAIILSALDAEPIEQSSRLLLTTGARVENSGQQWNESRTELAEFGGPPSLIEPVRGRIMLRHLEGAVAMLAYSLDGAGRPMGEGIRGQNTAQGWEFQIGEIPTTWYEIRVER